MLLKSFIVNKMNLSDNFLTKFTTMICFFYLRLFFCKTLLILQIAVRYLGLKYKEAITFSIDTMKAKFAIIA